MFFSTTNLQLDNWGGQLKIADFHSTTSIDKLIFFDKVRPLSIVVNVVPPR